MYDKKELESILDSCLSRMLRGESLKECLQDYPEQAEALRPLLQTAVATRRALVFKARPGFKTEARRQLLTTLAKLKEEKAAPKNSWLETLRGHLAAAGVSTAIVVLLVGGGLVAASGDSLPGELLYSFKLAGEQVMLSFTLGDEARVEAYARLADKRVGEIVQLAAISDVANIEKTTRRLDGYLASITDILSPSYFLSSGDNDNDAGDAVTPPSTESDPRDIFVAGSQDDAGAASELGLLIQQYGLNQVDTLQQALDTAPQASREALEQALAVTLDGYREILEAVD